MGAAQQAEASAPSVVGAGCEGQSFRLPARASRCAGRIMGKICQALALAWVLLVLAQMSHEVEGSMMAAEEDTLAHHTDPDHDHRTLFEGENARDAAKIVQLAMGGLDVGDGQGKKKGDSKMIKLMKQHHDSTRKRQGLPPPSGCWGIAVKKQVCSTTPPIADAGSGQCVEMMNQRSDQQPKLVADAVAVLRREEALIWKRKEAQMKEGQAKEVKAKMKERKGKQKETRTKNEQARKKEGEKEGEKR